MSRLRRRLVAQRKQAAFVGIMGAGSAIGLLKNLALAPVLGARELGYYGITLLVAQFGTYASTWGIINALSVELPLRYGREDPELDALTNRAFGSLAIPAATMTGLYVLVVLLAQPRDPDVEAALLLAAVPVLLTCGFEFFLMVLRSRRMLVPLGKLFLARAVLAIALGLPFGALWGFKGVVGADVLASGSILAACALRYLPSVRPARPRAAELAGHVRAGFPLIVSTAVITLSFTIDRTFVASTLPERFGEYTFATLVVATAVVTTGIFKQMVYPKLLFDYGAGMSLERLRGVLRRILLGIAAVGVCGVVVLLAVTPLLRHGVFSQYGAGLELMPTLFAGAAISVMAVYEVLLLATRRYYLTTVSTLIGAATALAGGIVISLNDPTLGKYAWLFTLSQATATGAIFAAGEWAYRRGDRGVLAVDPPAADGIPEHTGVGVIGGS